MLKAGNFKGLSNTRDSPQKTSVTTFCAKPAQQGKHILKPFRVRPGEAHLQALRVLGAHARSRVGQRYWLRIEQATESAFPDFQIGPEPSNHGPSFTR